MSKLQQVVEYERRVQIEIMREAVEIIEKFPTDPCVIRDQGRLIRKALRVLLKVTQ